jgi:hypothetical protein
VDVTFSKERSISHELILVNVHVLSDFIVIFAVKLNIVIMLLKKYLIIVFMALVGFTLADKKPVTNCMCEGIPLHGKVKVVKDFPDFKVKVVKDFPDLKVKKVFQYPDRCGEWQFVEDFPDFKIKFVEDFPDFKIKYVEHYPGLP